MWNPNTDCMRLVYTGYKSKFTVKLSKSDNNLQVMPRYWIDINGKFIEHLWKQATSFVWYQIYNTPGITMVNILFAYSSYNLLE